MPSWPVTGGLWQGKPFLELLQSLLIISLWLQDWVKQSPLESMICRKKNHKCHLTDWEQVEAHLNLHDACLQPLSLRSIAPPTLIFFFLPSCPDPPGSVHEIIQSWSDLPRWTYLWSEFSGFRVSVSLYQAVWSTPYFHISGWLYWPS
jgi:hypothetical protein